MVTEFVVGVAVGVVVIAGNAAIAAFCTRYQELWLRIYPQNVSSAKLLLSSYTKKKKNVVAEKKKKHINS